MAPLKAGERQANAPLEHVEKNTAFTLIVTLWDPHQISASLRDKRFMPWDTKLVRRKTNSVSSQRWLCVTLPAGVIKLPTQLERSEDFFSSQFRSLYPCLITLFLGLYQSKGSWRKHRNEGGLFAVCAKKWAVWLNLKLLSTHLHFLSWTFLQNSTVQRDTRSWPR